MTAHSTRSDLRITVCPNCLSALPLERLAQHRPSSELCPVAREIALRTVREMLASGPRTAAEIRRGVTSHTWAHTMGISASDLDRLLQWLEECRVVERLAADRYQLRTPRSATEAG